MLKVHSPLTEETEARIEQIIGCGIRVHRELGPGFLESVYRNAFCVELEHSEVPFEREKPVVIRYRGLQVATHRIDLVIWQSVVVELKALKNVEEIHTAQLLSYLRATGLKVGLIMNFNGTTLKAGLRRVIL